MKDLQSRADIELLVSTFYEKAMADELIGHFFTEVVPLDLKAHLPVICDFWESTLLGKLVYKGNPMIKHLEMAEKSPLKAAHFDRWLKLWEESLEQLFQGQKAAEALNRATQIARLMQLKIISN